MSEHIGFATGFICGASLFVSLGWFLGDLQNRKRDRRIAQGLQDLYEQSVKDLQNHRDEIIGKEGNEA